MATPYLSRLPKSIRFCLMGELAMRSRVPLEFQGLPAVIVGYKIC
jgi:hypothetical protein